MPNNNEYTPTTGQVFDLAILGAMDAIGEDLDAVEFLAQLDRWLAEHDREVAAQALRDFAAAAGQVGWDSPAVLLERLKARANRIENGDAVIAYIEGTETDRG